MKKVTIREVAKYANVSVATVSRILNDVDYPISENKKKAVHKAIKDLNYVPSISAQSLKSNKKNLLGLIVRDISDPYFAEIAKGVTETATNYGYLALVCNSKRHIETELTYYDTLRQHNVAGIIIAGGGYRDEAIQKVMKNRIDLAESLGIRTLALAPQGIDIQTFGVDNIEVGKKITKYLIDRNHTKIAFIGGDDHIIVNHQRMEGFMTEMKEHSIELSDKYVMNDEFTWEGGYRSAEKLLDNCPDITAICCANDNIAIGALRCIRDRGLKVPGDISLIGVGDLVLAEYTSPKLTTLKIPFVTLGKNSVEAFCGEQKEQSENQIFPTEIIERDSVRKL